MSLIYSMLMSVDGYVEDEHGRFDLPFSTKRRLFKSTSSPRQAVPTSTGEGCTSRWVLGEGVGFARYDFVSYDLGIKRRFGLALT